MCVCLSFFIHGGAASALSWAYPFVVWDGGVYQVTEEPVTDVDDVIGEVKSKPDEEGNYRGNASNVYDIGTKYYAVPGTDPKNEIAVQEDSQYVKAVYEHKAPKSSYFYISVLLIGVGVAAAAILFYLRIQKKS
nr:hypothetical protein [Halobacillus sp. A5]